jgi:hypothetical protein
VDLAQFRRSLNEDEVPGDLSAPLQALWWHAKGDWARAHDCAQREDDAAGALVHAFLHRVEGDLDNARYWYGRAGRPPVHGSLDAEWDALAEEFLAREI